MNPSTGSLPHPTGSMPHQPPMTSTGTQSRTSSMTPSDMQVHVSETSSPPKPDSLKKDLKKDKEEPKISKRASTIAMVLGVTMVVAVFTVMMASLALGPYAPLLMVPAAVLLFATCRYFISSLSSEKDDNMLNKAGVKLDNLFTAIGEKISGKPKVDEAEDDEDIDDESDVGKTQNTRSPTIDFAEVDDDDDDEEPPHVGSGGTLGSSSSVGSLPKDDDDDDESEFDLPPESPTHHSLPDTSTQS